MAVGDIDRNEVASLADSVEFNDKDLIKNDTLDLTWNDLSQQGGWDEDSAHTWNSIEANGQAGAIVILRDKIDDSDDSSTLKTYFYPLNTGENQQDPTLTVYGSILTVEYSSVEEDAVKAKYKRYSQDSYGAALYASISSLVASVLQNLIKTQAKYNFKKIDTNREFLDKNLTAFEKVATAEVEEISSLTEVAESTELNYDQDGQD